MSAWEEVLASALVGAERRPPPDNVLGLPTNGSLLTAAAALSTYRRAGFVPGHVDDLPEPAPAVEERPAPPAAAQILELLLNSDVRVPQGAQALVSFWLERAAERGYVIPPRLLPLVLDRAPTKVAVDAAGARGRWLIAQHEPWLDRFKTTDAEEGFHFGVEGHRADYLRRLREQDPAHARDLVQEEWGKTKAALRAEFVKAFEAGLSIDDELFLEAALDDRAGAVREKAVWLLAHLPEAQRGRRMFDRLRPLISVGGRLRKKLEVAFPDEPDAAARRDGITDHNRPAKTGLASWWLRQMVAGAPLHLWEEHLGLPARDIVRLGAHQPELVRGWTEAALLHGNAAWAAALIETASEPALLSLLPPEQAMPMAMSMVVKAPDAQLPQVIAWLPAEWPEGLSRAVVERGRKFPHVESISAALAIRLHPAAAPLVEQWVADLKDDDYKRRTLRSIHHAVTLRGAIDKELA